MPPSGILGRVARSADAPRTGRLGRASLFIDGSGQVTSLTFAFTAAPTESQGGEVTFTNATITNPRSSCRSGSVTFDNGRTQSLPGGDLAAAELGEPRVIGRRQLGIPPPEGPR